MIDPSRLLMVFAMPEEEQGLIQRTGAEVLFTGLGKVNAAFHLTKRLQARRAKNLATDFVINFGTAGSSKFSTHEVVECHRFVQRDMDVSAIGFAPGHTPFDAWPFELEFAKRLTSLPGGLCGSGDSFETGQPKIACEVLDMEAYALAKVCRLEGIEFISVKYITDGADHTAANDWQANLKFAGQRFSEIYQQLLRQLEDKKD